jgi:anti-sigma factor RsiW
MNFHDAENLSAYLDGQLSPPEVAALESRLAADPELRAILAQLREARGTLRALPRRRAPRNFRLTPTNPRLRAPVPRLVPIFSYASALATLFFLGAIALKGLPSTRATSLAAAPAMGAGAAEAAPSAEAPVQSFAVAAPTIAPGLEGTPSAQDQVGATSGAPGTGLSKASPPVASNAPEPIRSHGATGASLPWIVPLVLGIAAVLFASLAWYMYRSTQRTFRRRWLDK